MMCIKHVLIYFLILPIPAASPIFLLLFTVAAFIAIKPCGYCLSLLAILFLSTSPHSPFLHPSLDSSISNTRNSTTVLPINDEPLNTPIPNRTWLSLNGGRLTSPSLIGYQEMDKALSQMTPPDNGIINRIIGFNVLPITPCTSNLERLSTGNMLIDRLISTYIPSSSSSAYPSLSSSSSPAVGWKERQLPNKYVDISWKGIGMIVDFGWKRDDQGIKWEIEEVLGKEWVRPSIDNGLKQKHDEHQNDGDEKENQLEHGERSVPIKAGMEKINKFWEKIPLFRGNW
ncbi:uncharacterized protein IL334_001755 [Kwoniella shivajii]|uniref:BPL/LPL catalytic domain-containing protein n=1 Tax=Kwoniella shivajii TaxID=564305 RepID=A0ABZ1CUF2_9TREE|nr:hypothetical protein IL334_001755 [Kwoniella shivajii]